MKQKTYKLSSAVNSQLMKLCKTRRINLNGIADAYKNSKTTDRETALSDMGFSGNIEAQRHKEKLHAKTKIIEQYKGLLYILNNYEKHELITVDDIKDLCISHKLKWGLVSEYVGDVPDFAIEHMSNYKQTFPTSFFIITIPELFIEKYSMLLGDTIVLSNINPWRSNNDDGQVSIYSVVTSWGNGE